MQEAAVDLHGIVVADRPSILKATDAVEVGGGRLPGRFRMRGGPGEASVVAWDEAIKDALGVGEGAGLREPQFDDQPILESTEEPLDPSFALGRGRGDPADAQLMQRTADLRGGKGARQFVGDALGSAGGAMKQAVAIGIGGSRDPVAADEAAEEEEVSVRVFLRAKDAGEDGARGVIDGGVQHQTGATVLKPGMMAAIHLDEETGLGHAFAASTVARGTAGARATDARGPKEPLDGFA